MSLKLPKDTEVRLIESIKQYFEENMDDRIGDLKAGLLLDFFLQEMGPCVYNQAILDAQKLMSERVNDLDSTCYYPEFMYWHNQ
jgi:uncharacterized protein (DUF2164 family)